MQKSLLSTRSSRFLYVLQVQRFWLLLTTSFPRFQATMLSKFAFPSRYSRLVVIALCLVSACFQQVMSLEHGDSSRVSTAKSRINSHGDVQKQSGSSSTCWITMETKNALFPEIFAQLFFPDWFCVIVLLLFVILQVGTRDVIQEFEEHKTASEAKLQPAEKESSI